MHELRGGSDFRLHDDTGINFHRWVSAFFISIAGLTVAHSGFFSLALTRVESPFLCFVTVCL